MASVDALYHSDSRPANMAPEYQCPIAPGDHFGGRIAVTFNPPGFAAFIQAAFCIICSGGIRQWAYGIIEVGAYDTQAAFLVSSDIAHLYFPSLPNTFSPTDCGPQMDTHKKALWAGAVDWEMTPIMPGSTNWDSPLAGMFIAEDGDANVYKLELPNLSWIQMLNAVPQLVG